MTIRRYLYPGICRNVLLLILFQVCFYSIAAAQDIKVDSRLDKVSIPIGDQTMLRVAAHMPAKTSVVFPQLKDSIGKIKIVNSLKPDTLIDKNDPTSETITQSYTITSFDTGVYVIPELEFGTKAGALKTGTVTLQVKAVPVDTTKSFYDIKQPFAVSYNFWDWLKDHWLLVLLVLAGLLLIAGAVYYFKNRPKGVIIEKPVPIVPLDILTLNKLYALRDKKLWQQNEVKLYYSELTDVLREYLETRYRIKTQEQTTAEILTGLKGKDIADAAKQSLRQLLTLADLVKFAKENPSSADNEQSMESAIAFIGQTKELPPAPQKEELPQ